MLRRLITPVVLALVTSSAHAVGWSTATVTITSYHTTTSGLLFLNTSNNQNPDSCSSPGPLLISGDTQKFVFATVMAAQTSGQTVQLYYNGCSGGGTTGYPVITSVAVPHL